jgi:hypothetical protein
MILRNKQIANMWKNILIKGLPSYKVTNHTGSLTIYSNGQIYSYRLLIGEVIDGIHTLYNHTSKGGSYHSHTTSCHVGFFKPHSIKLVSYNV